MSGLEPDTIRTSLASRHVLMECTQLLGVIRESIKYQPICIRRKSPKSDTSGHWKCQSASTWQPRQATTEEFSVVHPDGLGSVFVVAPRNYAPMLIGPNSKSFGCKLRTTTHGGQIFSVPLFLSRKALFLRAFAFCLVDATGQISLIFVLREYIPLFFLCLLVDVSMS